MNANINLINSSIYQTQQIRLFEQRAIEKFGVSGITMMQRAGKAAFEFLRARFQNDIHHVAIFCGSGNNGGDGYVLARILHEHGYKVNVWQVGDHTYLKNEASIAYEECRSANVPILQFSRTVDIKNADLVVDAICGIGLNEKLREDVIAVIDEIAQQKCPVLAIDIPTGINADTGAVLGKALKATATITFIGLKMGLLTGKGTAYTGDLAVDNLQLPEELFKDINPVAQKINLVNFTKYLSPRMRDWHKGLSGHVLIVGGDYGYFGAPRMAAEAALRVGAGLVSVATRLENSKTMNCNRPEIMCHGFESNTVLRECAGSNNIVAITELVKKATMIVLGPGLGQSDWSKALFESVVTSDLPMLVDADGLNLLAQTKLYKQNWVLTPHPGEAARLLQVNIRDIQHDRINALSEITKRYGGVIVLKGAGSLVGVAGAPLIALCDKGNPGMASAGMGDVLSGVIGGLIAQGIPLYDAAQLGVYIHAKAGDFAAQEGERGTLAMDLMPFLRKMVNQSEEQI